MLAVFKGHDDIALKLIGAGAAPHIQDKVLFFPIIVMHLLPLNKQNHSNALILATKLHKTDKVVNALLDKVKSPSQLDIQDKVCPLGLQIEILLNSLSYM